MHGRQTLTKEVVNETLGHIVDVLTESEYGDRLFVTLELYAAHFNEEQIRVRFLLLVIAIESLASPTERHETATGLLNRWKEELVTEMRKYDSASEEFLSLDALLRELGFRANDSIRSQIRRLFASLPGLSLSESSDLQKRALRVYDKRSQLVHNGSLPTEELSSLETEARSLLEKIFACAMERSAAPPPA